MKDIVHEFHVLAVELIQMITDHELEVNEIQNLRADANAVAQAANSDIDQRVSRVLKIVEG